MKQLPQVIADAQKVTHKVTRARGHMSRVLMSETVN